MVIINCLQGTDEWKEYRRGVITGTRLKSVMSNRKDTRQGLICELISEKIAPIPETFQSMAMERGKIGEEVVKELLDYEITEVGMAKKDGCDWLGISPDGLVISQDGKCRKAVEIKTPEAKAFVRYALDGGIPEEYLWQAVQYFLVIDELEELDFVIFNPDIIDPKLRVRTVSVARKTLEKEICEAKDALVKFRAEWTEAQKKLVALTR